MAHNSRAHCKPTDRKDRKYKKRRKANPGSCGSPLCTVCKNSWKDR